MVGGAMDKMIASMLGITPEGMQQMVSDFRTTISTLGARLETIEHKQDEILSLLKEGKSDGGS